MRYNIEGEPFPVVTLHMSEGESINCQNGAMSWMSPNMKMKTSAKGGARRIFSGEQMFRNTYTPETGEGMIAFSSNFPGEILKLDISPGHEIIMQQGSYLASTDGVNFNIYFQKKLSAGLFGGESFIMQKLSGQGMAFAELDGHVIKYQLIDNECLIVSTGYLAMMSSTCSFEIEKVRGIKNTLFGGEGFFNARICGPGTVWLQSMPIQKMAQSLSPYMYVQTQTTQTTNN